MLRSNVQSLHSSEVQNALFNSQDYSLCFILIFPYDRGWGHGLGSFWWCWDKGVYLMGFGPVMEAFLGFSWIGALYKHRRISLGIAIVYPA